MRTSFTRARVVLLTCAVSAIFSACESENGAGAPTSASSSGAAASSSSGGASSSGSSGAGMDASVAGPADGLIPPDSTWFATSEWYRNIESAPVAEHSAQMIAALPRWGTTGVFQVDFSFSVLDAAGAAPVMFPPAEEGDNVPVPVPAKGYVEGDYAYDACPADREDCHLLIVDRGAKRLYEIYQARKNGAIWQGEPTMWKLDKTYPRSNRGQGCTSADAVGLAITPGLIGYRETKGGTIAHALRLVVRNEFIRSGAADAANVAYPASHGTRVASGVMGVPYGGRLRLKRSVSDTDPRFKTPGARAIVNALKRYGMIVADGGNIPLMAESIRVHSDADPAATWEGLLGPRDLDGILPTDFEVIGIPKDRPDVASGYFATRAEYEAELKKPLGCAGIVQP